MVGSLLSLQDPDPLTYPRKEKILLLRGLAFGVRVLRGLQKLRFDLPPDVVICDRDAKVESRRTTAAEGRSVRLVVTPERAPNAHAYAERFVHSLKEECLDRLIPIGERQFRRALTEFVEHYHLGRNHQGRANTPIMGGPASDPSGCTVARASELAQLLRARGVINASAEEWNITGFDSKVGF